MIMDLGEAIELANRQPVGTILMYRDGWPWIKRDDGLWYNMSHRGVGNGGFSPGYVCSPFTIGGTVWAFM